MLYPNGVVNSTPIIRMALHTFSIMVWLPSLGTPSVLEVKLRYWRFHFVYVPFGFLLVIKHCNGKSTICGWFPNYNPPMYREIPVAMPCLISSPIWEANPHSQQCHQSELHSRRFWRRWCQPWWTMTGFGSTVLRWDRPTWLGTHVSWCFMARTLTTNIPPGKLDG